VALGRLRRLGHGSNQQRAPCQRGPSQTGADAHSAACSRNISYVNKYLAVPEDRDSNTPCGVVKTAEFGAPVGQGFALPRPPGNARALDSLPGVSLPYVVWNWCRPLT